MDGMTDQSSKALDEQDFYIWTQRQPSLLRDGRFDKADVANLIEEIETLGRSERSAMRSGYKPVAKYLLNIHLLKMIKQPDKATPCWEVTILRERGNIEDILGENPGLKPKRQDLFRRSYASARREAARETKLDIGVFPAKPPFGLADVENSALWPPGFPA